MKLNLACVRDILLCVEDNTGYRKFTSFVDVDRIGKESEVLGCNPPKVWPDQQKLLDSYSNEEILYHFQYCIGADLIDTDGKFGTMQFIVYDLTEKGHETIRNLRSPKVFKITENIAKEIGVHSLEGICNIASSVVNGIIQANLNI